MGGEETELGTYNTLTWYLVRIRYEQTSASEVRLSYWINDVYLGNLSFSAISDELLLDHLELTVQEGSAWFDNIKIRKYSYPFFSGLQETPRRNKSAFKVSADSKT